MSEDKHHNLAIEAMADFNKRKFAKELWDHHIAQNPELVNSGNEWLDMVRIFHKVYEQPIRMNPIRLTTEEMLLRLALVNEEALELRDAGDAWLGATEEEFLSGKMEPDIIDALGDLIYVIMGFFIFMGVDPIAVMREIQLSNMSKLGADGKPIHRADGKVLKGPNYFKPDFKRLLGSLHK